MHTQTGLINIKEHFSLVPKLAHLIKPGAVTESKCSLKQS